MSMFSYKSLYHSINDKSEKRIYTQKEHIWVNNELFKILVKEDWYIDIFKNEDGNPQIRFVSGFNYGVSLPEETIQALLKVSKEYPEVVFYMEDSVDGYVVAEWQNGIERN